MKAKLKIKSKTKVILSLSETEVAYLIQFVGSLSSAMVEDIVGEFNALHLDPFLSDLYDALVEASSQRG